ncbi:MAG: hypothetical protein ACSLEL_01640 [Candidatus Malihini olakiniferum]
MRDAQSDYVQQLNIVSAAYLLIAISRYCLVSPEQDIPTTMFNSMFSTSSA